MSESNKMNAEFRAMKPEGSIVPVAWYLLINTMDRASDIAVKSFNPKL